MKKLFFIAAIAGAALVSCTKNELAPSATEQHEINFAGPVTQVVTKADLVPATYPEGTNFAVYAHHHFKNYASETNFTSYMRGNDNKGVVVTNNGATEGKRNDTFELDDKTFDNYWKPVTKYYWPMEGYLTFAAYSPDTASEFVKGYSITNGVTMSYTTPDVGKQYDLMLSDRAVDQVRTSMVENVKDQDVTTAYDGVHIAFKHVLSAVSFAVKTAEDYLGAGTDAGGYKITLKSLTLKNAYSTGTLTQFAKKEETAVNLNTVWSDVTTENTTGYAVCPEDVTLSTSAKTWAGEGDADLVMIPQNLNHSETSKVVAEIVYTVYHKDMGEEKNAITYTKSLPLATTNVAAWAPSTRYLYTIIIGMEEIVFAPTVTNWADPTPIEIPESTVIPTPTV